MGGYRWVAPIYDRLGDLFSGGQIAAAKASHHGALRAGERVLYAGAGAGVEAAAAASRGCSVTLVDREPAMIERARRALVRVSCDSEGSAEFCCDDVHNFDRPARYDAVVANFFLNVFTRQALPKLLAHLLRQLRPGGRLHVADFTSAAGPWPLRLAQRGYYGVPLLFFCTVTGNAWHDLYDYRALLGELGWHETACQRFRVYRLGPRWFESICFERQRP